MLSSNRCTQWCTGLSESGLRKLNHIHLAFDHDDALFILNAFARFVQTEDFGAFRKNRSVACVDVFRLFPDHGSRTKCNDLSANIADREHQAVAEEIVDISALTSSLKTGL